jgi:cyclic pyranopterin phosphate synthase
MPDEHYPFLPQKSLMTADEIVGLAKVFVGLGINKIRLTGGEPLVRKDFDDILFRLSELDVELLLTTNGILIDKHINQLKKAGVHTINISLDSLQEKTFQQITQRNEFKKTWENILLLMNEGFRVKLNVVAIHGFIEKELANFIRLTKNHPLHVRFIEFMPFDGNYWNSTKVITAADMLALASNEFDLVKLLDEPHATAKKYKVVGHEGTIAFITTMSNQFCGDCNRLRLTAEGKIKNCLFGKDEIDLLTPFRNGQKVEALIRQSVEMKHAVMGGQLEKDYTQTNADNIVNRSMIGIGG